MDAPEGLDDARRDLGRAIKVLHGRAALYTSARDYQEGVVNEVVLSPTLRTLIAKAGGQLKPPSFVHIVCDALGDRIELAGVTAAGAQGEALKDMLEGLDFTAEADEWEHKACYFGDYYVVIDPLEVDDEGRVLQASLIGRSPLTAVAVYSMNDPRTPSFLAQVWQEGDGAQRVWRAILYYDDFTLMLSTTPGQGGGSGKTVAHYLPDLADSDDAESWRIRNPADAPLMVHYRIGGRPYGVPQHKKGWAHQDAITKIAAVDLAATEAQGFPSRYALLDPMAESDDDIDSDFGDDGPDTPAAARDGLTTPTTGSSNLKDLPGTIKMLAGVKSVTQLDAADSDPMLKKLDWWVRAMATATGVPFFEFDMGGDQPSGESRRRASTRIINRAKKAQRALGASHLRLIDTLLGAYGIEGADVKVAWLPAEVANDAEGMELVKSKTSNGVPLKDALVEAGYLPETVDEWLASTPYSLSEVETIAASLGELAKAETLGAILPEETRALLPAVLTGARGEGVPPPADPEA